tara:strand:+ start:155 stop:373 length:219 start_codon:yes stop_codon:yes gene_type:complete
MSTFDEGWQPTATAIKILHISEATLWRRKKEGYFKPKTHYYQTGPYKGAHYFWNVAACRDTLGRTTAPVEVK